MRGAPARATVARMLADETPPPGRRAGHHVGVLYPGRYAEAAGTLGVHFLLSIAAEPGFSTDRVLLDPPGPVPATLQEGDPLRALPVILCSVSWELQVGPLVEMLRAASVPPLAARRDPSHPLIVAGGPLTASNASLLEPVADVVVRGDGEEALSTLASHLAGGSGREELVEALRALAGARPGSRAVCPSDPVRSVFVTPRSAFPDMHLVEVMRGCPHGCRFCVMSRRTGAPVRFFPAARVLSSVPGHVRRVGLVGPSVLEHPEIDAILSGLARRDVQVGISSARADRVDASLAGMLADLGLRTLTVGLDGPSARIRRSIRKGVRAEHVLSAARHARAAGIGRLKLYAMTGFPGETDEDTDELAETCLELAKIVRTTLSIGPLVPKRPTSLGDAPFVRRSVYEARIRRLRRAVARHVRLDAAGWREAHLEASLARMEADRFADIVGSHDMSRPFSLRGLAGRAKRRSG